MQEVKFLLSFRFGQLMLIYYEGCSTRSLFFSLQTANYWWISKISVKLTSIIDLELKTQKLLKQQAFQSTMKVLLSRINILSIRLKTRRVSTNSKTNKRFSFR